MDSTSRNRRRRSTGVMLHRRPARGGDPRQETRADGGKALMHRRLRRAGHREVLAEVRECLAGAL